MNEARLARVAGIAGIAGIVLLFVANIQLGSTPKAEDPAQKIVSFFSGHRVQALTFVVLFGIGYLLLITFAAGLRQMLRRAGDASGLPPLVFGAAVWVNVVGTVSGIAIGAAAYRAPALAPDTTRALYDLSNISFAVIGIPFAVLFGAASISAISTRALPRWIGWLGALIVLLNVAKIFTVFPRSGAFAPGGAFSLVAIAPIWLWTIAVGVVMIKGRSEPTAA